jgi:hypothetical protein
MWESKSEKLFIFPESQRRPRRRKMKAMFLRKLQLPPNQWPERKQMSFTGIRRRPK